MREVNEVSRTLASAAEERKGAEDRVRFLMRELSHRAKNQLAVVVAMARRTAEGFDRTDGSGMIRSVAVRLLGRSSGIDAHLLELIP